MENIVNILREEKLFEPRLIIAIFSAIIVLIIESVLIHKYGVKTKRKRKVELAKSRGHVIVAKRISYSYSEKEFNGELSKRNYAAVYFYEVCGIKKEKRIVMRGQQPPQYFTLYYGDSPKDVFTADDPAEGCIMILFYFIPLITMIAVYFLCESI